jgi:predicted GIY-YIG superfamily endonuclease
MPSWCYMLRCADGSFYVGCTSNIEGRLGQHSAGEGGAYTCARLPVELVWSEEFQHIDDAIAAERRVKGWTRAKKQALIEGDWRRISALGLRSRKPEVAKMRKPLEER